MQDSGNPRQINDVELKAIRDAAAAACDQIAESLLGRPTYRDKREMRWGHKGSLALDLGRRRGMWYDHESGEGGDIIALVRHVQGGGFRAALAYVSGFSGVSYQPADVSRETRSETDTVEAALAIWRRAVPIEGTPGQRYFADRGLPLPPPVLSRLRFDAWRGNVVCAFTAIDGGGVTGVHRIPIVRGQPKKSLGRLHGSVIRLASGWGDGVLSVAEGVESAVGAMIKGKAEGAVWATTGTSLLAGLPVVDCYRRLLVLGDNDYAGRRAADRVKARWSEAGKEVDSVYQRRTGRDWADDR